MALPSTNAETPIDSHRLDGSLWKPRSILSYPEGHFNPPSDLTLTLFHPVIQFSNENKKHKQETRDGSSESSRVSCGILMLSEQLNCDGKEIIRAP